MFTINRSVTSVVMLLFLNACATTLQTEQPDASEFMQAKAHSIDGNYFIGPQPKPNDFANLKDAGISHVINFRTPGEMEGLEFSEEDGLDALGIQYSTIPVGGDEYGYTPSHLTQLDEILKNNNGKVLLHCGSGYRASVITVAWLVKQKGMPLSEALLHAEGWWPLHLQKVMDQEYTLVPK